MEDTKVEKYSMVSISAQEGKDKRWRWRIEASRFVVQGRHGYGHKAGALKCGVEWGRKHMMLEKGTPWRDIVSSGELKTLDGD